MKIKILPHGPYEVYGFVPLKQNLIVSDKHGYSERWEDGKIYTDMEEPYRLCRCGRSVNKPFCSGVHKEIDFDGEETADFSTYDERAEILEGQTVDLMDDESLCAVARFCDRGKNVWKFTMRSAEDNNENDAIYEASACPAGRLTVVKKDGERIEPFLEKEIGVIQDTPQECRGPLWVKGGIPIESTTGESFEVRNRVTLCRCGESSNLPYCDASHLNCVHMQGLDE